MKFVLRWLLWIPVFLIAALFLIANRQLVAISLDPFDANNPAVTTPEWWLWVWLMLTLAIGFIVGVAGMWLSARPGRQRAKLERRELKALKKEMAEMEKKLKELEPAAPPDEELPLLETSTP